ncbi:MAG: beta strand repeat-containing protein, partial [Gemmatimonadales bacterium]
TPTQGTLTGTLTVPSAAAGVAIFSNLSIDKKGPGYTLVASTTAGGVTGATSTTFDINAGDATNFVITQQPSNAVAGASIAPTVTVEARDDHANVDPTFGSLVTLEFVFNAGNPVLGALSGATATASAGIATFGTLSINRVGTGYTIRAAASGGAAASTTSSAFNITPGLANSLAFTVNPTNTTSNATIAPAIKVTALDANSNVATSFNGNVVVAIGLPNPAGGTLSGTVTQAAVAGVATFSTLRIDNVGVYSLTASAGLPAGVATSAGFNIIASTATQLFFSVQPNNAEAGAAISTFVVEARDASGQQVTGFTADVTLTITGGTGTPGASLSGTTTATVGNGKIVGGLATFDDISIDKSGNNYKLTASSTGLTSATSRFIDIAPGAATDLVFAVNPSNATALAAIAPQVEIKAVDALGNTATAFTEDVTVVITAGSGTGGATLNGTTTATVANGRLVNGVASFNNLSIDLPSTTTPYSLDANSASLGPVTSNSFDITPAASSRLVFTTQPGTTTAGLSISPSVVLTAQDAVGTTLTGFTGDVTVTITSGTGTNGATLSGTTTATSANGRVVNGVATFNDLSIDKKGTGYRLSATASGLAGATSNTFVITTAPATRVAFTVHPVTTAAGQTMASVVVQARDDFGNLDNTFVGDMALTISSNPGGGTLSGTTTATAANGKVVAGVATFNDLSIDKSGTGYRLTASSTGLTSDISQAFSINGGPADHLTFTVAPSSAVAGADISNPNIRVTAFDVLGNVAAGFDGIGNDVTLAITAGTGSPGAALVGTATATAALGVAEFTAPLTIEKAGTGYTLSATTLAAGVTGTISATFNITPAAATKLGFVVQPSNTAVNAAITPAVQVAAQDAFGNTVTTFGGTVTIVIGTNAGVPGTLLTGGGATAFSSGVATFSGLSINNPGTGFTLSASSSPALTDVISNAFSITP